MTKKRLLAVAAMAALAPLTLTACGGGSGSGGGNGGSSAATVDSLTVLDYYNDEPGHTQIGDQLSKCGTSIGVGVMKDPVNTITIAIDGIGELTNEFRQ